MPTGTPPVRVSAGEESTSGSPSAVGSGSFHSSACVERPARIIPSTSWASASSSRGECLVLRAAVPAKVSSFSLICPPPTAPRRRGLVLLQRARLVDGGAAALLALHLVLRLVFAGPHGAAGRLGVLGDLPLHRALGLPTVALPAHVVALLELVRHRGALRPVVRPALPARRGPTAHIDPADPTADPPATGRRHPIEGGHLTALYPDPVRHVACSLRGGHRVQCLTRAMICSRWVIPRPETPARLAPFPRGRPGRPRLG